MKRYNFQYLDDSVFLAKFDRIKIKTQYIKIILLDFDQRPIQSIEGKTLSGSFNIDGSSAMRRTCNLTMIADKDENDLTNIQNLISINKKVEVLIGFENTTDKYKSYPILWFPQGLYLIISASITKNNSGVQISLTLHDKMALLNGECGGVFPAPVTFHQKIEEDENGIQQITKPTIFQIIQQLMNHFGKQPLHKIIIGDIDEKGKSPYFWQDKNSKLFLFQRIDDNNQIEYRYSTVNQKLYNNQQLYRQFSYGDTVGYKLVDAVFPRDLIAKAGDTIVSILDQIKNTLGNYQYFYDTDGNFIFQEIKNYLNNTYTPNLLENNITHNVKNDYYKGKPVYSFKDAKLVQSFTNNPQYQQVKNDFMIWGKKKTSNGSITSIRYHVAIDQQPKIGNIYEVFFIFDEQENKTKIYLPYRYKYRYNTYNSKGKSNRDGFPKKGQVGKYYYAENEGKLYRYIINNQNKKEYKEISSYELTNIKTKDYRTELFLSGMQNELLGINRNDYYVELKNEWEKIYNIKNGNFFQQVIENQDNLDFFLDLLNNEGVLAQFSVQNIGRRTAVISDDNINCIFEPTIPDIYIIDENNQQDIENGKQRKLKTALVSNDIYSNLSNYHTILNSAYEKIRAELYQYISYNNQVTISTIPVYHLQPNTRIEIKDTKTGIYGDYMIKTITLPLKAGQTMNITCTKALERI